MTGFDSKRQAALDKLFAVENELGLHYEPEQEPVATLFGSLPVYDIAPPKRPWVELTDEEIWSTVGRIADLVRADEREACADIAENWNSNGSPRVGVAKAIRARGNT